MSDPLWLCQKIVVFFHVFFRWPFYKIGFGLVWFGTAPHSHPPLPPYPIDRKDKIHRWRWTLMHICDFSSWHGGCTRSTLPRTARGTTGPTYPTYGTHGVWGHAPCHSHVTRELRPPVPCFFIHFMFFVGFPFESCVPCFVTRHPPPPPRAPFFVGEIPTCFVPALEGCKGLWSYDTMVTMTRVHPPTHPPPPRAM